MMERKEYRATLLAVFSVFSAFVGGVGGLVWKGWIQKLP